jgi:hypothetical protein
LERREDDDAGAGRQKEDGPSEVERIEVLGEFASVFVGPPADTGGHGMAIFTRRNCIRLRIEAEISRFYRSSTGRIVERVCFFHWADSDRSSATLDGGRSPLFHFIKPGALENASVKGARRGK